MGLDFGTTNSAVAVVDADGSARLASFPTPSHESQTFPSLLYFERRSEGSTTRLSSSAGAEAIERYLQAEERGRLLQSLKAYLGDGRFDGTEIFGRLLTLEMLIGIMLKHLISAASQSFDRIPGRIVLGRPVHFSLALSQADDDLATARLLAAVKNCGFEEVVFEFEPVAAAYSYEQALERDELIFIGDFGGGTSDFCILRVGPDVKRRGRTRQDVLGTDGVALAGDAFDRQIIRHVVAPRLGMGSQYISPPKKFLPIPDWPYQSLERWQYLSCLDTPRVLGMIERLRQTALVPERLDALAHLLRHQLGYELYDAVRQTNFRLSQEPEALFEFQCGPVLIRHIVARTAFEKWIEPELGAIATSIDRLLAFTGVSVDDIDRVFLTGGSSFVPAVRQLFVDRFGTMKIAGGDELTSVATGLALRAAEEWGRE